MVKKKGVKKGKKDGGRPAVNIELRKKDRRWQEDINAAKRALEQMALQEAQQPKEERPKTPTLDELAAVEAEALLEIQRKAAAEVVVERSGESGKAERCRELTEKHASSELVHSNDRELLVMEYVDSFRQQFTALYPERRPPYLTPLNEFGVAKFVCSTLRPTQAPYKELYDAAACAQFLSDWLGYELLDPRTDPPKHLPSPSRVARWQLGDSFDASMLLGSLLLGVGYDAYVVWGYVNKETATRDLRKVQCPYLTAEEEKKEEVVEKQEPMAASTTTYTMPKKLELASGFLAAQQSKAQAETVLNDAQARKLFDEEPEEDDKPKIVIEGEIERPYAHAWVLVQAGKREVERAFFLDPVTGRQSETDDEAFLGIEAVWNDKNYWVNMQYDATGQQLEGHVQFALNDSTQWEHVIATVDDKAGKKKGETAEERELEGALDNSVSEEADLVLEDLPLWCEKIEITRSAYEARCPKGKRRTVWRKCITEQYAPYSRPDGMVLHITQFVDVQRTKVTQIREVMDHRRDRLNYRLRIPDEPGAVAPEHSDISQEWLIEEHFLPGRVHHLKRRSLRGGVVQEFTFYSEARLDGLVKRVYHLDKNKMTEIFEGRDDRLLFRSVKYVADAKTIDHTTQIKKMTEKYARNPDISNADEDVMKRTFFVGNRIVVVYHRGEGRITHSTRTYNSRDSASTLTSTVVQVDPFSAPPKREDLFDEFHMLLRAEKTCATAVRTSENESRDINEMRKEEERHIELTVSVYDIERNKAQVGTHQAKDSDDISKKMVHTYLTPFLIELDGQAPKDEAEALKVYDMCLHSLEQALVEKEMLIIQRREELVNARDRRMTAYQRNLEHPDPEEDKAHDAFLAEMEFKIRILDERLDRHRENAFQRIVTLHEKMMKDPVLEKLNQAEMEERLDHLRNEHARKAQGSPP